MTGGPRHVLVLGAGGFLGSEVARSLSVQSPVEGRTTLHLRRPVRPGPTSTRDGIQVVDADLADLDRAERLLDHVRPDLVVNCAALADVDACERDPDLADLLNHRLPARLAAWTARSGARLVHVSTDAVFDGHGGPYDPGATPSPVNVYGRSKRAGEVAVLAADPAALVARTNIVGWSPTGTRSLLEHFVGRLSLGEPAPGWTDVHVRPLPVHWFWPGCERAIAAGMTGIVHLTGPELLSKHAFGRRVAEAFDLDPGLVVPVAGLMDTTRATRPPRLDVVPSTLAGEPLTPDDLDRGLAELRALRDAERLATGGTDQ